MAGLALPVSRLAPADAANRTTTTLTITPQPTHPRVRVKVRAGSGVIWRAGTAHILDDDEPRERQRLIGRGNLARRLCLSASAAIGTDPLTVRIDLDTR